jgi:hypothetical protein
MDPPEPRYAKSGDLSIADQVTGAGPLDLVYVSGFVSNLAVGWAIPGLQHFFTGLTAFSASLALISAAPVCRTGWLALQRLKRGWTMCAL